MRENKTSEAQLRANEKYAQKFERVNARFPIGTKARIEATGAESINGFIINAVEKELTRKGK